MSSHSESESETVTIELLAAEQAGEFEANELAGLPDATGESMFRPCDTAELFALAAIALSSAPGPCGSEIYTRYETATGEGCSSGTLYPILRDLYGTGVLSQTQLARHKRYQIDDVDAADDLLAEYEQRLRWWLRLVRTARDSLDIS